MQTIVHVNDCYLYWCGGIHLSHSSSMLLYNLILIFVHTENTAVPIPVLKVRPLSKAGVGISEACATALLVFRLSLPWSLLTTWITWIRCVQSIRCWKMPIPPLHPHLTSYRTASDWLNTSDPDNWQGQLDNKQSSGLSRANITHKCT